MYGRAIHNGCHRAWNRWRILILETRVWWLKDTCGFKLANDGRDTRAALYRPPACSAHGALHGLISDRFKNFRADGLLSLPVNP